MIGEILAILDSAGNPTGKTALKSHAHRMGLFHATVHIWFYTMSKDILIQQRGKEKIIFPLLWDVSVAGHIGAEESIIQAAIREVKEEIGITILETALEKIDVFKTVHKHNSVVIDCEFHHTFIAELKVPLLRLKKQENEVANLTLVSLFNFKQQYMQPNYVPHGDAYYSQIYSTIQGK